MKIIHCLIISLILLVVGFYAGKYWQSNHIWTGIFYPDKEKIDDQTAWRISPPLRSLEECRQWVNSTYQLSDNYDYECGIGCRYDIKYKNETIICRETHK